MRNSNKKPPVHVAQTFVNLLADSLLQPGSEQAALVKILKGLQSAVDDPRICSPRDTRLLPIRKKLAHLTGYCRKEALKAVSVSPDIDAGQTPMEMDDEQSPGQEAVSGINTAISPPPRSTCTGGQYIVFGQVETIDQAAGCRWESPVSDVQNANLIQPSEGLTDWELEVVAPSQEGFKKNADNLTDCQRCDVNRRENLEQKKLLQQQLEKAEMEILSLQDELKKLEGMSKRCKSAAAAELTRQVNLAKSQQVGRLVELEYMCDDLQKQLLAVESRKSKEAGANDLYVGSGATPLDLRNAAERIQLSVQSFSRELMKMAKPEWKKAKCGILVNEKGINLDRIGHVQFAVQSEIMAVAFGQLWESDHYFIFPCLPLGSDISGSQQHYFARYQQLMTQPPIVPDLLAKLKAGVLSPTGICEEVWHAGKNCISCGPAVDTEFESFCFQKIKALEKLDIWLLVPPDAMDRLPESFITFLLGVWLVHLLGLAFEQPACLFKEKFGLTSLAS